MSRPKSQSANHLRLDLPESAKVVLVASSENGQGTLLFDRLCALVRQGAGTARKWTRESLLAQLRGVVRLKVAPNFAEDIKLLEVFSASGLAAISDDIDGVRIERPEIERLTRERLAVAKVLNISGLPGCGKSAMLKRLLLPTRQMGRHFSSNRICLRARRGCPLLAH